MPVEEYELVQPDPQSAIGRAWNDLADKRPERAERLLDAVEHAVGEGLVLSYRVLPTDPAAIEVYMIPPRYALLAAPDAAALLRVDHSAQTIEFIEVVEDYGGPNEAAQWRKLQQIAAAAIQP
jgi:hypothetical protein